MNDRPLFGAGSAPAMRPAVQRARRPASHNLGRAARGTMNPAGYALHPPAPQPPAIDASQAPISQVPPPPTAQPAPPVPPPAPLPQPVTVQHTPQAMPQTHDVVYHQPGQAPASSPLAPAQAPPVQQPGSPAAGYPCAPAQSAAPMLPQQPVQGPVVAARQSGVTPAQAGVMQAAPPAPVSPGAPDPGRIAARTTPASIPPQPGYGVSVDPCVGAGQSAPVTSPQAHNAALGQQDFSQGQSAHPAYANTPSPQVNSFAQPAPPPATSPSFAHAVQPPVPSQGAVQAGMPAPGQPQLQPGGTIDDRKNPRLRALKGGMIILPGQMMSSFKCKIRNESRGGVLITLNNAAEVPAEFYLVRDSDPGNRVPCRVAWRAHDRLGAMFVPALTGL